jgi:hypothetical protein
MIFRLMYKGNNMETIRYIGYAVAIYAVPVGLYWLTK